MNDLESLEVVRNIFHNITKPAFTYSKLKIEALEQGVNMFKVNNKDTRTGVFIVNFEHISHLILVFLLLTLNM